MFHAISGDCNVYSSTSGDIAHAKFYYGYGVLETAPHE